MAASSPSPSSPVPPSSRVLTAGTATPAWTVWIGLGVVFLFILVVRLRLLAQPLERDEGEYAYAGQLLLHGIAPYKLAYNMKFPGVYGVYALIMSLFGQTASGIHFGLLLANLASILLVFLLARRWFTDWIALAAAASYALLSTSQSVLGMAGHATHFVVLPFLAGMLLLFRALRVRNTRILFLSGFLIGLCVLMKQHAVFLALFAGIYWFIVRRKDRPSDVNRLYKEGAILAAGLAFPLVLMVLSLLATGAFPKFWFWTFAYASRYVEQVPLSTALQTLGHGISGAGGHTVGLWILAGLGLLSLLLEKQARGGRGFLLGLAAASFMAVVPGFYFREHYFIMVLPALAFLAAWAVRRSQDLVAGTSPLIRRSAPVLLFLGAALPGVIREQAYLFHMTPLQACRATYGGNPFPESLEVARYLEANAPQGAKVAVLGSEPEIYFYSKLRSATGYIYTYPLMENHPFAEKMQEEMISEITAAQPEFLVMISTDASWLRRPNSSNRIFDWFVHYIVGRYELVGQAEVARDGPSVFHWNEEARAYRPKSRNLVSVLRRVSGS